MMVGFIKPEKTMPRPRGRSPHQLIDLRCPLYIGATSWPSLHDEERVDAAYNQEWSSFWLVVGALENCYYRINAWGVYLHLIWFWMVHVGKYTIHIHTLILYGECLSGFWDLMIHSVWCQFFEIWDCQIHTFVVDVVVFESVGQMGPDRPYNLHGVLVVSYRLFRGFRFPDFLLQFRWLYSLSRNPGADKPIRWSMILSNFTMEKHWPIRFSSWVRNTKYQMPKITEAPKQGQVIQPAIFHRCEKNQMFRSMFFRRKIRMNVPAFLG